MRSFALLGSALVIAGCGVQPSRPTPPTPSVGQVSGAADYRNDYKGQPRELLPDEQIQQVLNRLTFGARPGDADKVRAAGVDGWIEAQLHPERIDDSKTDELMSHYAVYGMKTRDIVHDFTVLQQLQRQAQQSQRANGNDTTVGKARVRQELLAQNPQLAAIARQSQRLVGEVQSAQLARAVSTDRQLDEVMVDFWENHFSVFAGKGQVRLFLPQYDRDVIRPFALGHFRDLLGAVAKSPAMLFFLDNWESAADSTEPTLARAAGGQRAGGGRRALLAAGAGPRRGLNENYARELMELHTLGVDGGYTQKDVQEVARALTGWTFNRQTGEFVFNPTIHDAGEKTILGQGFPSGRGEEDGERVLDIVARAAATAHFITTKLARHFVSDDPPPALVDRCAATFSKTDGDIRETLGCIVTSPEFFSHAAYRAKVKTPFELVASALRAVDAHPDTTLRTAQIVARLGQPIFGRQTPDGWPDRGDAWMNTGAILNRINFGLSLAAGQVPGAQLADWPDYAALRAQPREQQVDGVIKAMLGGQASDETRDVLMSGANPMLPAGPTRVAAETDRTDSDIATASIVAAVDSVMAQALRGERAAPAQQAGARRDAGAGGRAQPPGFGRPVNLEGLSQIVGLALGAPEFQRR